MKTLIRQGGSPGWPPCLIWVFAGRIVILLVLSWGGSNCHCRSNVGLFIILTLDHNDHFEQVDWLKLKFYTWVGILELFSFRRLLFDICNFSMTSWNYKEWYIYIFLWNFWCVNSGESLTNSPTVCFHLYANRNLRYSKWWPSFLLCCFWRVFLVYEELILSWFCLLDSIFKQHYCLKRFVWSEVLCFSISCLNHQTWREFRRITCLLVTCH